MTRWGSLPKTLTHWHVAAFVGTSLLASTGIGVLAASVLARSFSTGLRQRETAMVFGAVESGPLTFARLQSAGIAQAQLTNLLTAPGFRGRPVVRVVINGGDGGRFEYARWEEPRPVAAACLRREARDYQIADALHPYRVTLDLDRCIRLPEERLAVRVALAVGVFIALLGSLAGFAAIVPVAESFARTRRMIQEAATSPDPSTIRFLPLRELAALAFIGMEAKRHEAVATLARQVAHDIRAPLAALAAAIERPADAPEESRALLQSVVSRVRRIADDLLRLGRADNVGEADVRPSSAALLGCMEEIVAEKRLQHRSRSGVAIEFQAEESARLQSAHMDASELKRALSNLVENSIEALMDGRGTVWVRLREHAGSAIIEISDNGRGIAGPMLSQLGRKGVSFGKDPAIGSGSGLGLWHAKMTVESWGGRLEIESELGKGTTVRLILQRAEPPASGPAEEAPLAVLIDNDPLVRMNWKAAAKRDGKTLKAYPDAASFMKEAGDFHRNTPIYIDSDLGVGVKGEEAAKELMALGFTELRLSTGHDPDSFPALPHLKGIQGKEPPWPAV